MMFPAAATLGYRLCISVLLGLTHVFKSSEVNAELPPIRMFRELVREGPLAVPFSPGSKTELCPRRHSHQWPITKLSDPGV